jgi:hypothetical protein
MSSFRRPDLKKADLSIFKIQKQIQKLKTKVTSHLGKVGGAL